MVAGHNSIKRTVIDGKSIILLDGPPQVLHWNEFKSICKLFDDVDWFDIAEITGEDLSMIQISEPLSLTDLASQYSLSRETVSCLVGMGVTTLTALRDVQQDTITTMKVPMGQKRRLTKAVCQLLKEAGRPPWSGSFRSKSTSGKISTGPASIPNIDGALAEHPKFWADHMNNSKLIKLL